MWKPKGMHQKTFQLLLSRYEAAVEECLDDARRRFGDDLVGQFGVPPSLDLVKDCSLSVLLTKGEGQ